MKKTERHQIILNEIHSHNRVLLSDLTHTLKVSMDTVRRDLQELDKQKQLKKVHGGAVSNGFNIQTDHSREIYEYENKSIIAQKGISLLNPGDIILITGGSTNMEFARHLPAKMKLTFFTPSLPMAVELLNISSENCEVHFIGGKLTRGSQLATGGNSISLLSEIKADICFLGTGYLDLENGVTELDWEITQLKKAMVKASKKLVALTISKKLNTSNRFTVCRANDVDTIVTELDPTSPQLEDYRRAGINLL